MSKICVFDGCGRQVSRVDLCATHYKQKLEGKELRELKLQYHGLSESDRFMQRVMKNDITKCWNWTGSRMKNWHGNWRNSDGNNELVHRASWRIFVGELPNGMCVCHKCDNPLCVNPDHLFLGTQSENAHDMWNKGRARPGISKGEKHGMSKLTAEIVKDIRNSNLTGIELAKKYGITATTVCDVKKRRTWDHI